MSKQQKHIKIHQEKKFLGGWMTVPSRGGTNSLQIPFSEKNPTTVKQQKPTESHTYKQYFEHLPQSLTGSSTQENSSLTFQAGKNSCQPAATLIPQGIWATQHLSVLWHVELIAAGGQLEPRAPVCCTSTSDRGISEIITVSCSDIPRKNWAQKKSNDLNTFMEKKKPQQQ